MAPFGDDAELKSMNEWFAERGFGVQFTPDDDESGDRFFWADLTRLPSGRVVAPMYGRGATEVEAANSALKRFEVEQ
ncbi:MAG: hypothetical protein ACR2LQ_05000 [Acidimicrobiales bacterium]